MCHASVAETMTTTLTASVGKSGPSLMTYDVFDATLVPTFRPPEKPFILWQIPFFVRNFFILSFHLYTYTNIMDLGAPISGGGHSTGGRIPSNTDYEQVSGGVSDTFLSGWQDTDLAFLSPLFCLAS